MMNKLPSVAVLLAAYNGEKYICEQLDSILGQEGVDLSLIISVDKSTDSTLSIINRYVFECLVNIEVLPYGDQYGSAGRNFTRLLCDADLESYEYISFADQDDIWSSGKLREAIFEIKKHNVDGYSSNVTAFWEAGNIRLVEKNFQQVNFDYLFESPGPGCTFVLSSSLTRSIQEHLRSKSDELESLWLHDWYCYSFARSKGFSWFIDSRSMMKYRQHSSNEVGANLGLKSFMSRWDTVMSGGGFTKVLAQAKFIGQDQYYPIQLIKSKKRMSMLRLLLISRQCRRQKSHKLLLAIVCFIFFVKGCNYDVID